MIIVRTLIQMPKWMRKIALDAQERVKATVYPGTSPVRVPFMKPMLNYWSTADSGDVITYGTMTFYQNGHFIQAEVPDDFMIEIETSEISLASHKI